MGFFSTLGNVLSSVGGAVSSWLEEPLKRSAHGRSENSKQSEHDRLLKEQHLENERLAKLKQLEFELLEKTKSNDVAREIEREIGVKKGLSEQNMKEQEALTKLQIEIAQSQAEIDRLSSEQKMFEMELSTNLQIKRETEIVRIITEIEQLKKDKDLERMKAVSDAMMNYQKELTRINVEAVEAIGSMRIELQRKAYELIHEKTQQYNELQQMAIQQAEDQFQRIDNNSTMSESSKNVLRAAVDKKLAGIIDNATRFLEQLNDDMQLISKDINLITTSGQNFIQRHLEQFQLIGMSGETTALLESSSEKLVGFEK
jgi:hypothetical protein